MAKYKLLLPKMGESVAEATVIRWTKNPGDHIEADETVMEIATDKVDSDVPSPVTGKLIEQLCKENDIVQVGAVIAIIETGGPEVPSQSESPVVLADNNIVSKAEEIDRSVTGISDNLVGTPAVAADFQEPAPSSSAPVEKINEPIFEPRDEIKHIEEPKQPVFTEQRDELKQPVPYTEQLINKAAEKTSETSKIEGRFYSPLVKSIAAQEGISNGELDKIPGTGAEGRLTKDDLLRYVENKRKSPSAVENISNTNVITGPLIDTTGDKPVEQIPAIAIYETTDSKSTGESVPGGETFAPGMTDETVRVNETNEPEPASELEPVVLSNNITPEPVKDEPQGFPVNEAPKAAASEELKPEPVSEAPKTETIKEPESNSKNTGSMSGGDEIIEMDRMRRLIADHMVMSKHTSPHVTSFVEADVTVLVQWRDKIKSSFEKREGEKITFTPIFIEAVVKAIKDMPMINVQVNGTQIIKKKDINISMATALPSGNLIVPVIKRADELSLIGLTKAVNDLANRARNNKLKPDDVQGGTFTITNVGSFGNVMGTPIINQPQVAILAVGAIKKKPAVIETPQGDMIAVRHMMFLSLSYDHRVVDGALGGSFVRRIADYLEKWDAGREI